MILNSCKVGIVFAKYQRMRARRTSLDGTIHITFTFEGIIWVDRIGMVRRGGPCFCFLGQSVIMCVHRLQMPQMAREFALGVGGLFEVGSKKPVCVALTFNLKRQ